MNGQDDYQGTPDVDEDRWTTSYWTQYTVLLSRAARVKRFQAFAKKVDLLAYPDLNPSPVRLPQFPAIA